VDGHELFLFDNGVRCWWVGFEMHLKGEGSFERRGESVAFQKRERLDELRACFC
jgi:hypothetical protein